MVTFANSATKMLSVKILLKIQQISIFLNHVVKNYLSIYFDSNVIVLGYPPLDECSSKSLWNKGLSEEKGSMQF